MGRVIPIPDIMKIAPTNYAYILDRVARNVPQERHAGIAERIEYLLRYPDPRWAAKKLRPPLAGLYSCRYIAWRIIFEVRPPGELVFVEVGHRRWIYKRLRFQVRV